MSFRRAVRVVVVLMALLCGALALIACRTGKTGERADERLENFLTVAEGVYSGGSPEGDETYRALRRLGVRTVVSVDGARPNAAAARRNGMRHIHIPMGYDRVDERTRLMLVRAAREAEGPVYIHCHHGRHRAPVAAAIYCRTAGLMNTSQVEPFLERAGTARDYAGLWRDAHAFEPPVQDVPLPELAEISKVDNLTAAMASIDRAWDDLTLSRAARWKTPRRHPDIVPQRVALILEEGFREAARDAESGNAAGDLLEGLRMSEAQSSSLGDSLRRGDVAGAERSYLRLKTSCKECHAAHRN